MTPEEMKKLHDEHLAAEDRRDLDAVMATFHDDCFHESVAVGLKFVGKPAVRGQYEAFYTAFPDAATTQGIEAFGDDLLMDRGVFTGTLQGPLYGLQPTDRQVSVPFARAILFKDGLIHAEIGYFDFASLCEQAGLPLEASRATVYKVVESLRSVMA